MLVVGGYRISVEENEEGRSVTIVRGRRAVFSLPRGHRAEHRAERMFPDPIRVTERCIEIGETRIDLETMEVTRGPLAWFEGYGDLVEAARDLVRREVAPSTVGMSTISIESDGRIAKITDQRGKLGLELSLERPGSVGTKRMRAEFDGSRIHVIRRGMMPLVQSIDVA